MKYMILLYASQQDYEAMQGKSTVKKAWTGEQLGAMGAFMEKFHQEIAESGELVDAQGLDAPVHTRRIQMRGGVPVVTDGPYPATRSWSARVLTVRRNWPRACRSARPDRKAPRACTAMCDPSSMAAST
jgi:hypothetical protein